MITHEDFCCKVHCNRSEFDIAKVNAKKKLAIIIERFGDENGARLTDDYLAQLISEELRAVRVSKILFSVFEDKVEEKVRGATA